MSGDSLYGTSVSELIAAINNYRAANGLYTYATSSKLSQLAQFQSDYQASISTVTHTGPGGTRPIERAYSANYGDGKKIFISEIIWGGYGGTVDSAVGWWKTSQIHNDTMLSGQYLEIGAGVAFDDAGMIYFTAECGWITGYTAPDNAVDLANQYYTETTSAGDDSTLSAEVLIIPVQAEAVNEDGSITHTVRSGQALWNIAAVYNTTVEELRELNGLTEWSFIYPGDEIIVRKASTPEPTEKLPTLLPTATRIVPTFTPTKLAVIMTPLATDLSQIIQNTDKEIAQLSELNQVVSTEKDTSSRLLRWVLIISLGILMLILFLSLVLPEKKPKTLKQQSEEDPITEKPKSMFHE
ncbi:MAG: LysM peptidoglycan-binding domain-containing protein [Anaerolineales bacterium]|nr:LysM peptidoglycan-binding domain-containing protein [Anaerolineales bacterium]